MRSYKCSSGVDNNNNHHHHHIFYYMQLKHTSVSSRFNYHPSKQIDISAYSIRWCNRFIFATFICEFLHIVNKIKNEEKKSHARWDAIEIALLKTNKNNIIRILMNNSIVSFSDMPLWIKLFECLYRPKLD